MCVFGALIRSPIYVAFLIIKYDQCFFFVFQFNFSLEDYSQHWCVGLFFGFCVWFFFVVVENVINIILTNKEIVTDAGLWFERKKN